jgi:pyruvate-formate lyase-activating enzyme
MGRNMNQREKNIIAYRQSGLKQMTSSDYSRLIDDFYSEIRGKILCGNKRIVPTSLGLHLANRDCCLKCHFCSGRREGVKVEESALKNPGECLEKLDNILNLADDDGDYVKEIHFDGDSSDPILPKTKDLFQKCVYLIQKTEEEDGLNRMIHVTTNGVYLNRINEEILSQLDLINISVNACNREIYRKIAQRDFSQRDFYSTVLSNIANLCQFKDRNQTSQFVRVSYVISRDESRGICNFFETGIEDFAKQLLSLGVNDLKFRFSYNEKSKSYQDYVTKFIEDISGKYKPMTIFLQKPYHSCSGFKYCISPLVWPVIGPDAKLYACPHSIKREMELYHKRKALFLVKTDKGSLCNFTCPPFMRRLNEKFNLDMEDPNFLKMVKGYCLSENVYPIASKERLFPCF